MSEHNLLNQNPSEPNRANKFHPNRFHADPFEMSSSDGFSTQQVYLQGVGEHNDDAIVYRPEMGLFAVIDGATALNADAALSGAVASNAVKASLEEWDGSGSLIEAVIQANRHLNRVTGGSALTKDRRPSCCITAIRFGVSTLEFAQAGDCMAFVDYQGAEVRCLTHDSVSPFDSESVRLLVEAWKKRAGESDIPVSEWPKEKQRAALAAIRNELRPTLANHREMMNVPGGYSVLDGSPEAESFIEHGVINASLVSRVLLLSDGMQLPLRKFCEQDGWLETSQHAFQHGLKSLLDTILAMENEDAGCFTYPRLKQHDDKSGLLIHQVHRER